MPFQWVQRPGFVIARSDSDEAIQGRLALSAGLLRCARNDAGNRSRDASSHPSFCFTPRYERKPFPTPPFIRREAERREAHHPDRALCGSTATCSSEHASPFGAPPRHSPAARRLNWLSSSSRVSSKTAATGVTLCIPSLSAPRSAETGLSAGRAVTRSRPGAVCETARGDRTCSTF
jgi:hypothetical protein